MDKATKLAETKAVKKALKSEGIIGASVRHEDGWLNIEASTDKPYECFCDSLGIYDGRCKSCSDTWSNFRYYVLAVAKQATGRDGDYNGRIQTVIRLTDHKPNQFIETGFNVL